ARVDRFQGDASVAPGVAIRDLLALVTLDSVTLTAVGIDGVAQLHEHDLALPRADDGRPEEAVRTVRDGGFHRLTDDLGHEHARAQAALCVDGDPLPVVVLDVLRVAERSCHGLEGDERYTGHIAVLGTRLDDLELWLRFSGTAPGRRSSTFS